MYRLSNSDFFSLVVQELNDSGKVRFRVKGVSMYPLLRNERDEVLLSKRVGDTVRRGDIVLFRYRGGHVLHRVRDCRDGICTMRGDNTYGATESCGIGDVLGTVAEIYRRRKDGSFRTLSPASPGWKAIAALWRVRCNVFRCLSFIRRKLF